MFFLSKFEKFIANRHLQNNLPLKAKELKTFDLQLTT